VIGENPRGMVRREPPHLGEKRKRRWGKEGKGNPNASTINIKNKSKNTKGVGRRAGHIAKVRKKVFMGHPRRKKRKRFGSKAG